MQVCDDGWFNDILDHHNIVVDDVRCVPLPPHYHFSTDQRGGGSDGWVSSSLGLRVLCSSVNLAEARRGVTVKGQTRG